MEYRATARTNANTEGRKESEAVFVANANGGRAARFHVFLLDVACFSKGPYFGLHSGKATRGREIDDKQKKELGGNQKLGENQSNESSPRACQSSRRSKRHTATLRLPRQEPSQEHGRR